MYISSALPLTLTSPTAASSTDKRCPTSLPLSSWVPAHHRVVSRHRPPPPAVRSTPLPSSMLPTNAAWPSSAPAPWRHGHHCSPRPWPEPAFVALASCALPTVVDKQPPRRVGAAPTT